MQNLRQSMTLALGVSSLVLLAGCGSSYPSLSAPFETFRGARLYAAGTDALEAGDVAGAIEDLEQAARLAPRASEIQNHLGLAYWADGQKERAQAAFERSLELDCENTAAERNLANLEVSRMKKESRNGR